MDATFQAQPSAAPQTEPKPSGPLQKRFSPRPKTFGSPRGAPADRAEVARCANMTQKRVGPTILAHPRVVSAMSRTFLARVACENAQETGAAVGSPRQHR